MQYIKIESSIYKLDCHQFKNLLPFSDRQICGQRKVLKSLFSNSIFKKLPTNSESFTLRKFKIKNKTNYEIISFDVDHHQLSSIKINNKLTSELAKVFGECQEVNIQRDRTSEKVNQLIQNNKNVGTFYLWSSGGGGHKSAKDAQLEKEAISLRDEILSLLSQDSDYEFKANCDFLKSRQEFIDWCKQMKFTHEADVLIKYLNLIGKHSVAQWDDAQRNGNVPHQERLAGLQCVSDVAFAFPVFLGVLKDLCKHRPKKVVSTQAMANASIIFAIKIYNIFFNKSNEPVQLHLYMTDMPTELSEHFFAPLRKLYSLLGKKNLILYTAAPNDSNIDLFKLSNFKKENIRLLKTAELPVRPVFIEAAKNHHIDNPLTFKINSEEEFQHLQTVCKHQNLNEPLLKSGSVQYPIGDLTESYFLMLGSQPTYETVIAYINTFLKKAQADPATDYKLFAFAGKFSPIDSFYVKLCQHITSITPWPSNLGVIPLSFQDPEQLVSLELNCHTITRSGGATIMELLVLEDVNEKMKIPKKRFIHAETVLDPHVLHYIPDVIKLKRIQEYEAKIPTRTLEESIPLWERGNYLYLKKKIEKNKLNTCSVTSPGTLFTISTP